jgi:hypothetical protein
MKHLKNVNLWAILILVAANLFAWAQVISEATAPYIVEPIRDAKWYNC